MTIPTLARLQKVELRKAWQTEDGDFTPWLAEPDNIVLLGETVGIELEVEAQEKEVGPFRADILCKDAVTGNWVLIENQLARTDHTHLGQLLTYAAGLNAVTIVWISSRFTDEHRAALDWLNEITDERFNFFGLEVELWQIGDSPAAPKFNVVCKPNDWVRTVRPRGALSEVGQARLAFWAAFKASMEEHSPIRCPNPRTDNWLGHSIGRGGFFLSSVASTWDSETKRYTSGELRVELVIDNNDSKAHFDLLQAQRDEVEREMGQPLTWYSQPGVKMCRVYIRQAADIMNRDNWPSQHEWLRKNLEKFREVFAPRVKQLDAADWQPTEQET